MKPNQGRNPGDDTVTVYEVITTRIVEMLQQGTAPWHKPWNPAGEARNLVSGKGYRGINVFLLSAMPFASPYWLTYRQAAERGGSVRKGSKGCPVVFWRWPKGEQQADEGKGEEANKGRGPLLRYYTVFNVEQCEGIEAPATVARTFEPIPECERIVREMPNAPRIEHGGDRAFYRPSTDSVSLPPAALFETPALYYSVLFHELTHSTGHESRLARTGITDSNMFGSHEYSREELVAEMGAAFLCGIAGIEGATLQDSSAYLASWIRVLKGDSRLAITAAAQAQKAADHILGREFSEAAQQQEAA
jgi:antirestriction protein ArdC